MQQGKTYKYLNNTNSYLYVVKVTSESLYVILRDDAQTYAHKMNFKNNIDNDLRYQLIPNDNKFFRQILESVFESNRISSELLL